MKKVNSLIQTYVGPNLPVQHIFVPSASRPKELLPCARMYYRKWLVHPFRRHATHFYSKQLSRGGCDIIGITGSAGKTTTKEMLASILSQRFKTAWSPGNIDPVYNIPTTVLGTKKDVQKLILEMGIEFPGEMDFYTWLARPRIGIVTTVYWTHTEFLGSLENVIKEKAKMIQSLPADGIAILNADDSNVRGMAKLTRARVVWYSTGKEAEVMAKNVRIAKDFKTGFTLVYKGNETRIRLPLTGEHFVSLALAASAVALESGMSLLEIKRGLEKMSNEPHRMSPITKKGVLIIDDTYNANPLATIEALKVLSIVGKGKRKVFALGDMKELGVYEEKGHREVGAFAAKVGVEVLLGLGGLTKNTIEEFKKKTGSEKQAVYCEDKAMLVKNLKKLLEKGDVLLIKGSRSMGMEEVVSRLK